MRQVIAFHVGSRDRNAARELWQKIPEIYQQQADFYTDLYEPYVGVFPEDRHHRIIKQSGLTNHIERLCVRSGSEYPDWLEILWHFQNH